jgi:hypothetical protein
MNLLSQLDPFLPEEIRTAIEQRYYARINEQASLEQLRFDPHFLNNPGRHVALFSDHGVVHVRDVAGQVLQILDTVNGILIPKRSRQQLAFMKGYGVMVAYLHDIGMVDFSAFGRAMHPEFASQAVFSPEFEPIIETIWLENCGNVAWRLSNLAAAGLLDQPPQLVLREMLAMSNCHSKSKTPIQVLNDPEKLRQLMCQIVMTDLRQLYRQQRTETGQDLVETELEVSPLPQEPGYGNIQAQPFQWLVSPQPQVRELVNDIVDTLRVLRCADALRQRGTVLKTSGSYEIFVDQGSGKAIFALRNGQTELYLLEMADAFAAGEANIASSELDQEGNLRISFYRGAFANLEKTHWAVHSAALMVNDIQSDVIESFQRRAIPASPLLKSAEEMQILLEGVDDNLEFSRLVLEALRQINPQAAAQGKTVPSLQKSSDHERELYLAAPALDWDLERRQEVLVRVGQSGHKTTAIDPEKGFQDVKLIKLATGELLLEEGAPAGFVYIPLDEGLRVIPLGGYPSFLVQPWMPLGITGVIRGAIRNATIIAEQAVQLLMMPKEVYLRYWHRTYSAEELVQRLQGIKGNE